MNNKLLKKYAEIRAQIAGLEEVESALKEQLVCEFQENKVKNIDNEFGKFTLVSKTSWKYTDAVKELSDNLKIAQITEQESGNAKATISTYLSFKAK